MKPRRVRTNQAAHVRNAVLVVGGLAAVGAWWWSRPVALPASYHEVDLVISGMH